MSDHYLEYKKIEQDIIDGKISREGVLNFLEIGTPMMDDVIRRFKYAHCDLNKAELAELYRILEIDEKEGLVGGDVYGIVKEGERFVYTVVRRIDLIKVLRLINTLIETKQFR